MAEAAVVRALIDDFTGIVLERFSQEVSLIVNFRKDFEFFLDELSSIKCLLMDAGERRNSSLVSNWLDSLEDFVADAEYLVEQCGPVDDISAKLKVRLKIGHKIRGLKERLERIQQNAKMLKLLASVLDVNAQYGQGLDVHNFKETRERSHAVLQESQIVGMDGEIQMITEWILKEGSRPVIAIVGMGGQGKTLLLQRIFNSKEIRQRFHHQVWLAISQKFDVMELLHQVLREFEPNHNSMSLSKGELINKIHRHLEGKLCLFAVDDVWDRDAWEKIGLPFGKQDKFVLTTRDEKVAKAFGAGDQILLKSSLSAEHSWQLFCNHAFPKGAHHCPEALDKIAHEIVNKCGGLPLAIKTIGAYLARLVGGLPNDWEWTLRHLSEAYVMSGRVMPCLKLSYQALPPHLKPCFLYCSVFPKNSEIESEYLVYGWIAQGFVSAQLQDAYDVGRSYMEELIDRCLIEVSEFGGHGRVKNCKVHDLLHDLAVSEQTKCLLKPGGQLQKIPAKECQGLRRISLMKNEISTIKEDIQCPGLRILFLSHNYSLHSISASFFHNMRHLCVLDLSCTLIRSLPDSIGNLKLLKYMNLSRTMIEELPEALSGLRHLQFLDLSETPVKRLHSGIDKHKYMLHLKLGPAVNNFPVGISKLIYLQTLTGLRITVGNATTANAFQLRDLKRLTLLQHLSLQFDSLNAVDLQLEADEVFRGMTKMRNLYVSNHSNNAALHLPTMERLEILHLCNCVVPKWIFQLQNLMELTLEELGNCSVADLTGLERIPNLKKLHLGSNTNPNFNEFPSEFGKPGAFLNLEELVIVNFMHLKSIPWCMDAMSKLKCLRMKGCKLPENNIPERLAKLKNLKEVELEMWVDAMTNQQQSWKGCSFWKILADRQVKIKVVVLDKFNGDIM